MHILRRSALEKSNKPLFRKELINLKRKLTGVLCMLLAGAMFLCGCSRQNEQGGSLKLDTGDVKVNNFLKINEHEISFDMYRYWYLTFKASAQEADPNIDWSLEQNREDLKKQVLDQLKYICAAQDVAEKYDYQLSEQELADIEDTMKSTFESAENASEYRALLAENHLTQEIYEEILTVNTLYSSMAANLAGTDAKTNKIVFTLDEALQNCNENYYRLMDIYFMVETADAEGNALSDAQIEANKAAAKKKAEAALAKIKSGTAFVDVMKQNKTQEEYESGLQAYYPIAETAESLDYDIAALEIGETSDIIYVDNTYIILHRAQNDDAYLKEKGLVDNYYSVSLEDYYAEECLGKLIKQTVDAYKVTELGHYDKITPETLV